MASRALVHTRPLFLTEYDGDTERNKLENLIRAARAFSNEYTARWSEHFRLHGVFSIAEWEFGAGLHFLHTLKAFSDFRAHSTQPLSTDKAPARLHYYAIAAEPLTRTELKRVLAHFPELQSLSALLLEQYPLPVRGWHRLHFDGLTLVLIQDEIGPALAQLRASAARMDDWHIPSFGKALPTASQTDSDVWLYERLLTLAKTARADARLNIAVTAIKSLALTDAALRSSMTKAGFIPDIEFRENSPSGRSTEPLDYYLKAHLQARPRTRISAPLRQKNIAVIGAGIAGCASARLLAERGFKVCVFEASAQVGGVLAEHDYALAAPRWTTDHALATQLQLAGLLLLRQYVFRPEFRHCLAYEGFGELSEDQNDLPGPPLTEYLVIEALQQHLGCQLPAPIFWQNLGVALHPQAFCEQLLSHENIRLQLNSASNGFAGNDFAATIFCQGHRSIEQALIAPAHYPWQIIRGQCTHIPELEALKNLRAPLRFGGYLLPAENGQHYIGASFERDVMDISLSDTSNQRIWSALATALPQITGNTTALFGNSIAGLRLTTRDHLPLCGAYELAEACANKKAPSATCKYWLNTGHGAHGLMTAFVGAEYIAAALSGDAQTIVPALLKAISPARYRN